MSTRILTGGDIARGFGGVLRTEWPVRRSSEIFELRYGKALVESTRRPGAVPVYGTNGQTGLHDESLFSGPGVVVGRKGAGHLGVHWVDTDFWVIDTAYSLKPSPEVDLKFAYYLLKYVGLDHLKHGTSNPSLTRDAFGAQYFPVPPLSMQQDIAETLSAFDNKIESNRRARAFVRGLGRAKFQQAVEHNSQTIALVNLTTSLTRGVTPNYADGEPSAPIVINQKCIRDGWVSLEPARRMHARDVVPAKRASGGDILVNSTGTGTLGRLARWHEGDIFVDSHVSVVKPKPSEAGPIILAYALFGREADIEDLATGSTGQTELSPARLGSLPVVVPVGAVNALSRELLAIEESAEQLAAEIKRLEALRDTLLPELLSGRIRVPEKALA